MTSRQVKFLILFLLSMGGLTIITFSAGACLGARPLTMGGAFVAVSDDAHAGYWNPAGLALLSEQNHPYQLTGMYTLNNRDFINYQEWLAYGQPYLISPHLYSRPIGER